METRNHWSESGFEFQYHVTRLVPQHVELDHTDERRQINGRWNGPRRRYTSIAVRRRACAAAVAQRFYVMSRQQLDYAGGHLTRKRRLSPRFCAAIFISSGLCALVGGVISAIGDHFKLSDIEIYSRGIYLLATPLCAVSALTYLAIPGRIRAARQYHSGLVLSLG